uniref:maternal protein tudor-like isoform X2 n=1 Tax=Vespula vulgaris TaxID=7454 RepID=UPI00223AFD16|nr:maternal protein tudor-like isoform X2 [Vespula vulgaris]
MATIQQNSEFIIFVTHVEAEHQFLRIWGQIDKNSATYVERMILPLFEKFAIGSGYPELQEGLSINALCCARFQNDGYYRARVCNICPDGKVVLQFIDYGNIEILPQHEVYLLRNIPGSETLQSFPPVAYEFTLANIIPINNVWDNKTIETIKKILRYNEYKACCLSTVRNHTFIKLYYNNEDFGELLVKRHMAMDATMQDLFRPRRIQQMSPYHMQDRRMINEARVGTQSNANPAFNTMQGQGAWQNVSTPYVQPQKLVPHAPVQEALVFKSRVLDVGSKYHVYVSFVEDGPQKFSVQVQSTSEILTKLMRDINSHPMEPLQEPPLPGSVCLGRYTIDKVLCRAVVMAVMENKCKLYYVDFGHSEVLPYTDIFQLPPQYINPRVLSIRFTLSGVKELNVTPEMTEYFKKIVSGRSLVLHVRPPEGPPLIQYGDLYDNEKNIKDILRQAFTVPVTVSNMVVYQEPQKLSKGAERTVHVSFVESYMKFFIQLDNSDKSLESIMIYLADYVKTAPTLHPNQISVGTPCAALYESQWYRAKILNVDGDKIRILYVDYGNEVTVTAESLRVIHNDLVTKLPAQAIKCILRDYNTLPTGEECYNQFEMLILEKSLYMAVIDVLPGGLLVDLYDPEIRDDIKNILHRFFPSEKNSNIKSNSHECEHQSSIKVPKKIQSDNINKGNKANQEDPTKNMPIEHTKSKPWKNDLNGERQDNRYEKSNSSHDNSRNDRSSKDRLKNNNTKKDEPYNKRNYNDSNSFYKVGRDSRSRGRSFGNDSRFNRSSGFDKNWSDKDSDTSSRSSGKRGRGSGPNRHSRGRPRTEGVSARLHNSRWNDNDNDKEVNKSGKTNSQYNQKMHHSKDRANYKNNVTSNKESSSESRDMSKNLGTINNSMQNNEKLQLSKLSSENIEIPSLDIILGAIKTCMTVFISSPTDFYIQLNPDYLELDTLMENIASMYENGGDLLKQSEIKPEKYCIAQYSEDLKWYRAVIKSVEKQQVIVQFIDYGNIEIVHLDKIKTIQEQFLKLPIQTIHCKLFAAKNQIWDLDAIESFSNRTDGKVLEIEFLTKDNNIYEVMLREIINNVPEPIYINEDFFDGTDIMKVRETALNQIKQIDIVEQSSEYDYVSSNSKWAKEQFELGSHKDIIITWFINPNNFYCQILDKEVEFRNMMNEIQRMYVNRKPVTYTLQVGAAVIAIFSEDKALYRAEIIENKSDEYIVQYIDFGNRALVNKSDIYQVEKKLMQLPKQAYHCSLQNIKPFIGSKWSEVNTQAIDDCFNADKYGCLFHNIENDKYIVSLNNCRQDVADILVNKNLASYAIVNTIMPTDENSTNELDKSLNIQKIDINLLNGQTLKVRVCNVQSASKFHIELSSIMESSNDKCVINKNFKMLTDTQNQPIECCLLNASSFETNKNWKEIIENKELIMYVEEVNNNRLIIKLYDLMGNKIKSQKDLDEKIYPICPMPILNQTYKIIVSYADHSGSIWLQRSVDYDKNIHLSQALEEHYANCGKTLKPEIDMLCAVKVADGYWNRAKIIKFTDKSVYVNFIDYGNTQEVSIESLMELDPQFFVPYQLAINASLTVTLNGTLSEQINILQDQLSNRNLTANFSNVNKKWIVELFDNEEKISDKFRSMNLVKSLAENESENYQLITGKKYNVRVSHIDSPSQFWIQLTNEAEILKRKYVELQADISTCPLIDGILEESSLCVAVYSIDNMWYRAEVLDADEDITTVRFIDYGNTDVIDNKSENIRALTDNLKSMKRYATKSRLDIIPVDSEDWSEATCDRFSNLVTTADSLEALIIADSIPKRVELFVNDKSISEILVEEHHAVRIYAEQDLIDEIVELELDPHSAFVSHINSPSEFWVQEEKSIADLEVMSDRFMVADMFPKVDEIKENLLCVAKFPEDEQWYRARVISHYNGETKVIYIDYGNSAISTEIRTIPEDLVKIAPLSRRCSLVLPEGLTKWSNEACQEFTKLAADGATIFLLDVLKEQEISLVRLTLNEKNVTDLLAVFCEKQITDIEERLPPLGEENSPNVVVSHVNTPAEFWVQAEASIAELEVMSDRLQAAPSFLPLTNLENGTICAAKYPDDEQWYRAKILSQNESGVNVLYIDYGNTAINTELRILPEDIVNIPTLSKRCALQIPYYISFWSEEACKTFKDLAADGATMFQFEILDNEDPMHVKLSIDGKDITEILLPLCKDTNTKSEKCIVVEQITNSNIELYNKLTNTKENPEKLNELTQKSTNTIVCSVNEKSSTELLEQKHIHESVTASIEETNSFTNITELSIDDIIKNMIEDTHRDSENEDSINIENIEIIMQSSSENLITQEISKADNNFDINYDLIINDGDNKREDDKDEKRSTNVIVVDTSDVDEKLSEQQQTKCSLETPTSEKSELKVVKNTETDEEIPNKEEVKYSFNMLVSEKADLKVIENIETDEKFPDKEETKCSLDILVSEETDLKAVENIETNEKFPDKEETKYSLNILVSEETDLKVVVNTETSEKCLDKEETKYFPDMLVSKETDLKVVENIEISEKFPDKEETKCSPNMLISEEIDLKVTENTEAIEKSLDKQKITCSPNTFLSNVDVSQNSMKQEKITCSLDSSETEKPGTNIAIEGILKKDTEKSSV